MERYYPGHDVVDVLALSGYNWGTTRPYIGWRSFEEIFDTAYERLTALGPNVWIAEVASSEEGGEKAAWIREMLGSTAFPRSAPWCGSTRTRRPTGAWRAPRPRSQAFRDWFRVEAQR
jgi:hypothetical protein